MNYTTITGASTNSLVSYLLLFAFIGIIFFLLSVFIKKEAVRMIKQEEEMLDDLASNSFSILK